MATHRLTIPNWRPTMKNAFIGRHWAVKAKLKRADREMVAAYAMLSRIPTATGKRRVSLEVVLTGRQKQCDEDAFWPSLLDALVECGQLVDDSPKWLTLGGVTYRRDGEPGTTIILDEVGT